MSPCASGLPDAVALELARAVGRIVIEDKLAPPSVLTDCRSWRTHAGIVAGHQMTEHAAVKRITNGAGFIADIAYRARRGRLRYTALALSVMMSRLNHLEFLEVMRTPDNTDAILLLQGRVSRKTRVVLERAYGTDFTGTWEQAVDVTALFAAA